MAERMRAAVFLPAKGRSERVENKNLRSFNGEPFFCFALRKLLGCAAFDAVYIDSEDDEILRMGARLGAVPLKRDLALATNTTDGHALFANEVRQVNAETYAQALCTAPFLKAATIDGAMQKLAIERRYDSIVLGKEEKLYEWCGGKPVYGDCGAGPIPNSADLSPVASEAMSFYAVKRETALRTGRRIGDDPMFLACADPVETIDVDTEEDFRLAETVVAGMRARENRRYATLAAVLTSAILSDTCDALGIDALIRARFDTFGGRAILGPARTLALRKAVAGDDPAGIYDALGSYAGLAAGDVIVVKGAPDLAYFGGLNASLAIRAGAVGAIVAGATRDTAETRRLGFPVWAENVTCRDVRNRMVVAAIGEPVEIGGRTVNPSDTIFADREGVLVLPRAREKEILVRALEAVGTEAGILIDVAGGTGPDELVERHGFF